MVGVLVGSIALTGCDFDVYQLPLPGGADVGSDPITVKVEFEDVLDLVPKSSVKVNDVTVGQVTDVRLDGYTAEVTLELRRDTELPDEPLAEIRQTSLLGEKFVALSPPEGGGEGKLESGDVIPLERSGRNPEVEEVLGALSLILNGGGVAQLKTITQEINKAVTGREDDVRSVLTQLDTFTATLDSGKEDILLAIEKLNQLSIGVRQQQDKIDLALDELPSALVSIDSQREDLVKMLQSLTELSDVGVRVIKASKDATISSLDQLQPVLNQLAASGDDFVNAFNVFLTYPFVDEVVGRDPQVARNLHMGDYTNLSIQLELDLSAPLDPSNLLPTNLNPTEILNNVTQCLTSGDLSSKACQDLLGLPGGLLAIQTECQKPANRDKTLCTILNQVPGLPQLPTSIPGLQGGSAPALPTALPSVPLPSDLLGPLLGGLGLGRSATGDLSPATGATSDPRGLTMGQLQAVYDPSLVNLLVPQMVPTGSPESAPAKEAAQ